MNIEKLEGIRKKYDELTDLIVKPEIIADNKEWTKLVKERSEIEPVAETYDKLKAIDAVSYVRFASVYREFKDVATFMEELKRLNKKS